VSGISREAQLAAISECVTIVKPSEVLAVRLASDYMDDDIVEIRKQAEWVRDENPGVRIIFVTGEEFARIQSGHSA
jgi:hypothetical protein